MTAKLVALWGAPEVVEAFDKDYEATHIAVVGATLDVLAVDEQARI
jgi:hypothetical protein